MKSVLTNLSVLQKVICLNGNMSYQKHEQEIRSTTAKMLFVHKNGVFKTMNFCSKRCEDCLIRFTCLTNRVTAFDLEIDNKFNIINCIPHPIKDEIMAA